MPLRKPRKVTTPDKLYVKPKVEKPPLVMGKFNKYVRYHGMISPGVSGARYFMSEMAKIPFFVSHLRVDEVEDWLGQHVHEIIPVYTDGDTEKPRRITPSKGFLPDRFLYESYVAEWNSETEIWLSSIRTTLAPIEEYAYPPPPRGAIYTTYLAEYGGELGFVVKASALSKRYSFGLHSLLAAQQPGNSGGLRYRGLSPALRRLYYLAQDYMDDSREFPHELEPLLADNSNKDNDDDFQ